MKITYLDHSGFAVECGDTLLVFDEYNPKPAQGKSGLAGGVVTEADVRAHAHCCSPTAIPTITAKRR